MKVVQFAKNLNQSVAYMYFVVLFIEWCDDYEKSRVDVKQLQVEIDTYMQSYDKIVEAVCVHFVPLPHYTTEY